MAVCIERAGALSCSRTCYLCTHPMSAASHLSEHTRCHMTANSALLYFFLGLTDHRSITSTHLPQGLRG